MREWGESLKNWLPAGAVVFDLPLRDRTTFRIGGPASLVVEVHRKEDLIRVVQGAIQGGFPWFLLGGGSNVLFSDRGFEGVVILNRLDDLRLASQDRIESGAGRSLMEVVRFSQRNHLSGAEDLAGIPGSLGGAIVGNAGAFGRNIAELLEWVELIDEEGRIERVSPSDLDFDYRESRLKYTKDVVISASLKLEEGDSARVTRRIDEILDLRSGKHPSEGVATAGSFFKNLPPEKPGDRRVAAGLILDRAGALGLSVGDATVFEKHANIVVNRGNATAAEVLELTRIMKKLAYDSAGVMLEEEVRRIGFSSEELKRTEVAQVGMVE